MFHHVYFNCVRTNCKVENFQFVLCKNIQERYIFTTRTVNGISRGDKNQKKFQSFHHSTRYTCTSLYSIVTSKLCHVTSALKQFALTSPISSISYYSTHNKKPNIIMTWKCFIGQVDHYNGVTVDSQKEFCATTEFSERLAVSLEQWIKEKKRTIWFRVHLSQSEWIPILVKAEFKFHHARGEHVVLYRWLVRDEECNVPHYAHTNLGVGAFVYNKENNEILVIKEKYVNKAVFWKLPGGYVEPGEDLETAAKREVLEETGIQTTFNCLTGFRHAHGHAFGCSDIYIIVYMTPINFNIKKCDREISECRWMKINDYINHPEVMENNKMVAQKMLEFFDHRKGLAVKYRVHSVTEKPIAIYSLSTINEAKTLQ